MPSRQNYYEMTQQARQLTALAALVLAGLLVVYIVWSGVFTVSAHEQAVVMRFGRYDRTVGPGLHFKMPWAEQRVLVDTSEHSLRLPWGVDEKEARGQQLYVDRERQEQSLILTGDLYAAVVEWNVIWRVVEPRNYLFSINAAQVDDVILAVARSTMHRAVGDNSADEILTGKREAVALSALDEMTELLRGYECGVEIVDLQLQRVTPPDRVRPAFDEVNASIQMRDQLVNQARRERNQLIPTAEARRNQLIREAEGYAGSRLPEAEGEITALLATYEAYQQAPEVTRERMYLETMERVLGKSGAKTILDSGLQGPLPLLNLDQPAP